jgi:hypothetical protein
MAPLVKHASPSSTGESRFAPNAPGPVRRKGRRSCARPQRRGLTFPVAGSPRPGVECLFLRRTNAIGGVRC